MMFDCQSFGLTINIEANEVKQEFVIERLREFNRSLSPSSSPDLAKTPLAQLEIYVADSKSEVIGGLIGRVHSIPGWLEISAIWVQEAWRKQGVGRELMNRAEIEAKARGCSYARLATSDFQAPGFYKKLGYSLYGTLPNCPAGVTVYYFSKELN